MVIKKNAPGVTNPTIHHATKHGGDGIILWECFSLTNLGNWAELKEGGKAPNTVQPNSEEKPFFFSVVFQPNETETQRLVVLE